VNVDLLLWRHAEAQLGAKEDSDDMDRVLTSRGEKQAARVAAWLDRQLPEGARILVSPARRAEQTVLALGRKYKVRPELSPQASVAQLLELVQWPDGKSTTLVVGHQPWLGQTIAHLLGLQASECPVKKGAVWWLRHRQREGGAQTVLLTVQSPDVL
jgi:phosphohistidine phosphatase